MGKLKRTKKLKRKRRSCPLCKPHKTGWDDRRSMQEKREDGKTDSLKEEIEDLK